MVSTGAPVSSQLEATADLPFWACFRGNTFKKRPAGGPPWAKTSGVSRLVRARTRTTSMQLRRWLQQSPYLANSVLAAAIMGVGDMAAQRVEHAQAQGPPQSPPRCAHGAEDGRWDAMPTAEKSQGKEGGETYSFRYSWPRAATMVSYSFLVFSPMTGRCSPLPRPRPF